MLSPFDSLLLAGLILFAALLYSSVGHAGASGYLAAMALLNVASEVMKPTALILNIIVATIATVKFYRAGHFAWSIFLPFALTAVPLSFLGSSLAISERTYKLLVGAILIYAAFRLFLAVRRSATPEIKPLSYPIAILAGLGIGLLSGLTGTGGGIFLTPLLLFTKWTDTRKASGISAAFILLNSIAGLLGDTASLKHVPAALPLWAVCAVLGGWIGASYGSQYADTKRLLHLLSVVLVIAGLKLMLT